MTAGAPASGPARLLVVIGSLQPGGTEYHLAQVLPRLDRSRWRPMVYCIAKRGALADGLEARGVPVVGPPIPRSARRRALPLRLALMGLAWLKLLYLLLRRRPAAVHFFLPEAYLLGAPAAIFARVPVKIMSRRSLSCYQRRRPGAAAIEARLHPRMTAILVNSRRVLEEIAREPGVDRGRVTLLYNGIDPVPFEAARPRAEMRAELGIAPDAAVVAIVANLIPYKAHDLLLDALGRVKDELPAGWRLLAVGHDPGGDHGARLKAQAERLGIAGNVLWLGLRRDVPDLLAAADVAVLCSDEEGFSNAVLEAMAAGLPVVVTDVGGNAEAVRDGETGFVVPPRDADALGAALVRLVREPELARRLGAAGRARVKRCFSLESCVRGYEALYSSLLGAPSPKTED